MSETRTTDVIEADEQIPYEDPEALERFREYRRTGDRAIRNGLIERYARFAEALARRFANRGEPLDDLSQVALLGLLKSVERFDPERGQRFEAFAAPTILGEIRRHFRDRGWTMRVPRRIQELYLTLDSTVSALSSELGRSPTTTEIAQRASVSVEDVLVAMEASHLYRPKSLDAQSRSDGGTATVGENVTQVDASFDGVEDRVVVERLLERLPERERTIVYLRFFEELTQSEIAARVGLSQMHVSRLLSKSLELLRHLRTAQEL